MADHETRELKHRLKNVNKVMGRQGQTIYDLRCQMAELRDMIGKNNRGYYRRLDIVVAAQLDQIVTLRQEIGRLQEKLDLFSEKGQ